MVVMGGGPLFCSISGVAKARLMRLGAACRVFSVGGLPGWEEQAPPGAAPMLGTTRPAMLLQWY